MTRFLALKPKALNCNYFFVVFLLSKQNSLNIFQRLRSAISPR
jgi:hypothetical protein